MKSCRSVHWLLVLLIFSPGAGLSVVPVVLSVRVHDSVVLPCFNSCDGLIKWSVKVNPFYMLAQCNQTSCQTREGFSISHHQYQQGNFSLTINKINLKTLTSYTCLCNNMHICEVLLQIKARQGPSVKVKRHDLAVLPCSEDSHCLVKWSMFRKPSEVLAECNQTSCTSMKKGYQMIYNQYLHGNYSLTICDADFSKRGLYTCKCDGMDIYDVQLQIESLNSSVHIHPNSSLVMELDIPDAVEVIYSSSDEVNGSSYQICKVDGESLGFSPEYKERISFALELKNMNQSDSGVYTVRDPSTKENIHIYTVNVTDDVQPDPDPDKEAAVPVWAWVSVGGNVLLVLIGCLMMSIRRRMTECVLMTNIFSGRGEEEENPSQDP